jgi:high-affinity iron transporter
MLLAALPIVHFVIGLREGVEAALVVGIIAGFLYQEGRRDALRYVWIGVGLAIALCVGVAAVLELVNEQLPQRRQEAFEAFVGVIAVAMVTFMVVFMRRHSKDLKGDLHSSAGAALARGSAYGLVLMAFLAVLREGLETAMFLLAAFQATMGVSPLSAGLGATAGLLVAAVIGFLIFRAGMRLNLARFFRFTAILLVIIAAGLLSTAVHHFNEAGLITVGNTRALDLSAVIIPSSDSITTGLITGLLGLYAYPTKAELFGYLVYAVPMLLYVLWPQRRPRRERSPAAPPPTALESS